MHIIRGSLVAAAMAGFMYGAPSLAHHSFAAYDMSKSVTAQATIKEFRWGAPHSSIVFIIRGPGGEAQPYTMITAFPAAFTKQGIPVKTIHVGDKVELTYHPNTNGSAGGAVAMIKFPNGKVFKDMEAFGAVPKN